MLKVPVTGEMVERSLADPFNNGLDIHCSADYMDTNSFTSKLCAKVD